MSRTSVLIFSNNNNNNDDDDDDDDDDEMHTKLPLQCPFYSNLDPGGDSVTRHLKNTQNE